MRILTVVLSTGLMGLGWADTITLRDGRVVNGTYLGGDSRSVRFAGGDRVETFNIEQISTITFGGGAPNEPPPPMRRRDPEPQREERGYNGPELRSGTALTIRMIDSVDSQRDSVGKTFRASLDEPVVDNNGNTIIPRGADVVVKLVDDKESGKLAGRTVLTLSLAQVSVNGRMVDINTMNVSEQSGSRTARSGKVIGGAAAAGAIIGAIAGGGKGAAIGAGAGAGAGTVAEVATKGQKVHIPSETRLTFTLQDAVRL
ncbi:MAG: hypothetical protein LAO79_15200 [Acidobacteriia bacterium]|nr:hypothetical protein [Terriglobia bacterium]